MLASRQATVAAWLYSRHLVKMRAFDFEAELKRMKAGGELPSAAVDYTMYAAVAQGVDWAIRVRGSSCATVCAGFGGPPAALGCVVHEHGVETVHALCLATLLCSPREIKRMCIKLITSIGSGQFGEVGATAGTSAPTPRAAPLPSSVHDLAWPACQHVAPRLCRCWCTAALCQPRCCVHRCTANNTHSARAAC